MIFLQVGIYLVYVLRKFYFIVSLYVCTHNIITLFLSFIKNLLTAALIRCYLIALAACIVKCEISVVD